MAYPVRLDSSAYHRHYLTFALGMLFREDADTTPYEPALCKLASFVQTLEVESELVRNPAKRPMLQELLVGGASVGARRVSGEHADARARGAQVKMYASLAEVGSFRMEFDEANHLYLSLVPRLPPTPEVHPHHVPVMLHNMQHFTKKAYWDPTLLEVLRCIDGHSHVKRVSFESKVDLELTRRAVRHLMQYGCVTVVDVFQFSNMYVPNAGLRELYRSQEMHRACCEYVRAESAPLPPIAAVFSLYCQLQNPTPDAALAEPSAAPAVHKSPSSAPLPSPLPQPPDFQLQQYSQPLEHAQQRASLLSIGEFCTRRQLFARGVIDPRRFVLFGVLNKLIRRVHEYPLLMLGAKSTLQQTHPELARLCDGQHSMDAICCALSRPYDEVMAKIRGDPAITVVLGD